MKYRKDGPDTLLMKFIALGQKKNSFFPNLKYQRDLLGKILSQDQRMRINQETKDSTSCQLD